MNAISDDLWKKIEDWEQGRVDSGFRLLLDDVVQCFCIAKRATPELAHEKWGATLSELNKIATLASSLSDCLEGVSFEAWKAFFGDCSDGSEVSSVRSRISEAKLFMNFASAAVDVHKRNKDCTQKYLNRTALDVIVAHIDDAYFRHTGSHLARGKQSPIWLLPVMKLIDGSFGAAPTAIDDALKRLISTRKTNDFSDTAREGKNFYGAIFRWGNRYLAVRDDFSDAVGCDIISDMDEVGAEGYLEILKDDLQLLELVRQPD